MVIILKPYLHSGWCDTDIMLPSFSVLEYKDKLFTHSNPKPTAKERILDQGIVKLPLVLYLSTTSVEPCHLLLFYFFNPPSLQMVTNQVTATGCRPLTSYEL